MCSIFTMAMHFASDLLVSTKRMDEFLRLPEVSQASCVDNSGPQNGEIAISNGDYGWYSTNSKVEKIEKKITTSQWILTKACLVNAACFIRLFLDVEEKEDQAQVGDSTSRPNID